VNSTLNGANACYVFYNRAGNSVSLLNDAATAWLGPVALGSSASVHNSACVISGAGSSAAGSGNTLTLNLNMSFYHAFTGTKNIYMYAQDNAGAVSGWQARGTVFVP
jgi:hypothetical protein